MDEGDTDEAEYERSAEHEQRTYVCDACGESFETEKGLKHHLYAVGLVD